MRESISGWQKKLMEGFTSASALLDFLELPHSLANDTAAQQFKMRVPRSFASRMQKGNPADPLLRQVLAVTDELQWEDDFGADPLVEKAANPIPGLLHKYQSRVLLTLTGVCAVNCRYCFRRHFPYEANNPGRAGWQMALDYIVADSRIHEVILSGGDPLLVKNSQLAELLLQLSAIPHVHTVRFHTRIPIVLPERIDNGFLRILSDTSLHKVMVFHSNHAQELDENVRQVSLDLRETGCHLLNQSVLLVGVNDSAEILAALSERLWACGVLPYYLHVLDKVRGATHFDMPLSQATIIFQELQRLLPGYLVPRLAREEAGKPHKTLLN